MKIGIQKRYEQLLGLYSNKQTQWDLYIGFTNDLVKRIHEHKNDLVEGFTKRYGIHTLVYYETGGDLEGTLQREKQLKSWKRKWKIALIEKANPEWRDLYEDIV